MYSSLQDLSHGTVIFYLVTWSLKFDLLLKNFNLGCYLVMVAAQRASLSGIWFHIHSIRSSDIYICHILYLGYDCSFWFNAISPSMCLAFYLQWDFSFTIQDSLTNNSQYIRRITRHWWARPCMRDTAIHFPIRTSSLASSSKKI